MRVLLNPVSINEETEILGEVESLVEVKWAGLLTWASIPDLALLSTFHSAGRWMKSPEPSCRGSRRGG